MKKIIICLMSLLLSTGAAFAQKGLNCYPVFRGKVIPEKQMVMTEVREDCAVVIDTAENLGVSF